MADGMGTGIMSGFIAGQEAADVHAESQMKQQMGQIGIQRAELDLARQRELIQRLHDMTQKRNAPGGSAPSSSPLDTAAGQADTMSRQMFDMANVFQDYPEQSIQYAEVGGKLAQNAATIKLHTAQQDGEKAATTAHLMEHVAEAKNDPVEFNKRWRDANMIFQGVYGEQSRFANAQPTPDLVDSISKLALSKVEEAKIKAENARAGQEEASAALARATIPLRQKQAEQAAARAEAIKKSGGVDKKQVEIDEARVAALDNIKRLRAMIEADPNVVGFTGTVKHWAEFAKGKVGMGESPDKAPQEAFESELHDFTLNMQKARSTAGGRQLKSVYEEIKGLTNLTQKGISAQQAMERLETAERSLIRAQEIHSGEISRGGKEEKPEGPQLKGYKTKEEVIKAFKQEQLDYEDAQRILNEQFNVPLE